MNNIRQIQELNKRELEAGVRPEASWHTDYRDTAYIYIGGLPYELSEGDIVTIFSQFGEPTFVHLNRDKETGKSKGFAFLRYEDQRSTDLAVDNLGGATIMGRIIRVDHTRYKKKDDEEVPQLEESSLNHTAGAIEEDEAANEQSKPAIERPPLPEELELAALIRDHDDDDPMKAFLIQEKKDQIAAALAKLDSSRDSKSGHKSRRSHRPIDLENVTAIETGDGIGRENGMTAGTDGGTDPEKRTMMELGGGIGPAVRMMVEMGGGMVPETQMMIEIGGVPGRETRMRIGIGGAIGESALLIDDDAGLDPQTGARIQPFAALRSN